MQIKIQEIKAANILSKSKLSDLVINPYIGCQHACKYCYAKFMQKFTGHESDAWGDFVDIKINAAELLGKITNGKNKTIANYMNRSINIGSVTDPYQPIEQKYKLTRKILQNLIPLQPDLFIITKSYLVTRDIDLLKQFSRCTVAISLGLADDKIRRVFEPIASSVTSRIAALQKLHAAGINTALFIAPLFPYLSDWRRLLNLTRNSTDKYFFEDLFIYPSSKLPILQALSFIDPILVGKYLRIQKNRAIYWQEEGQKITAFCEQNNLSYTLCFH